MHRQNQAPIFYLTLLCLKQEDQLVRTTIFRKHQCHDNFCFHTFLSETFPVVKCVQISLFDDNHAGARFIFSLLQVHAMCCNVQHESCKPDGSPHNYTNFEKLICSLERNIECQIMGQLKLCSFSFQICIAYFK